MSTLEGFAAGFFLFIKNHQLAIISASGILQLIGSVVLGLFSFNGIKIKEKENFSWNGAPFTSVTMNTRWLIAARFGLIVLLVGITLGTLASMAGVS